MLGDENHSGWRVYPAFSTPPPVLPAADDWCLPVYHQTRGFKADIGDIGISHSEWLISVQIMVRLIVTINGHFWQSWCIVVTLFEFQCIFRQWTIINHYQWSGWTLSRKQNIFDMKILAIASATRTPKFHHESMPYASPCVSVSLKPMGTVSILMALDFWRCGSVHNPYGDTPEANSFGEQVVGPQASSEAPGQFGGRISTRHCLHCRGSGWVVALKKGVGYKFHYGHQRLVMVCDG